MFSRVPPLLRVLTPWVGMDVCSPGEVTWALEHGWPPEEISYTGTNVSDRDLATIVPTGVHVNVDLLSQREVAHRRLATLPETLHDRGLERSEEGVRAALGHAPIIPPFAGDRGAV